MSSAFSGVLGTVRSGSLDMDVHGWSADVDVSTFDATTTADSGWEDTAPATKKVSGSFEFFYNLSKKPTGATANLLPGALPVPTLTFQVTTGEVLTGPGLITKLSLKSKVKDGFVVTASFTSRGAWTLPS